MFFFPLNFLAATKRSWIEAQPSPRVRKAGGPANVHFAGLFQRPSESSLATLQGKGALEMSFPLSWQRGRRLTANFNRP